MKEITIESYKNTKKLVQVKLKVEKRDSVYLYFMLESHEGICFYSTIEKSISDQLFREIEIYGTIEFESDINNLISRLKTEINIEIISSSIVLDSKDIVLS